MTTRFIGGKLTEAYTRRELIGLCGGIIVYGIVLAVGRVRLDDGDPDWQQWVVAGGTVAAALFSMTIFMRVALRTKEVDRLIVSESTSLAFVATMLGVLTYGLLESIVALPRLSAWTTWTFGMTCWIVLTFAISRVRL